MAYARGRSVREQPLPEGRINKSGRDRWVGLEISDDHLHRVILALEGVAEETGKSIPQVALNRLAQRPYCFQHQQSRAANEQQLRQNLWRLVGGTLRKNRLLCG